MQWCSSFAMCCNINSKWTTWKKKKKVVETICWVVAKFVTKYGNIFAIVAERKNCIVHVLNLSLYEWRFRLINFYRDVWYIFKAIVFVDWSFETFCNIMFKKFEYIISPTSYFATYQPSLVDQNTFTSLVSFCHGESKKNIVGVNMCICNGQSLNNHILYKVFF